MITVERRRSNKNFDVDIARHKHYIFSIPTRISRDYLTLAPIKDILFPLSIFFLFGFVRLVRQNYQSVQTKSKKDINYQK